MNQSFISTSYPGIKYKQGRLIAGGSEGMVYFGESQGEKLAIKIYRKPISQREKDFNKKLATSKDNYNHLVKIHDFIDQPQEQVLIMELGNGDLARLMELDKFKKLVVNEKHKLFQQVVEGVWELDSLGYYHRDIKPQNILYFQQNNEILLKISDYGIVKQTLEAKDTQNIGTIRYSAPEQLTGRYDKAVDIWQLGIIWFLMMGVEDTVELAQLKLSSSQVKIDQKIQQTCQMMDEESQKILIQMLQLNPSQRISLQDLRYYLINLVQFEDIQQKLQGWLEEQNIIDRFHQEFEQIIEPEDLNDFQQIIEHQKDLIQKISDSPIQKKDLHRDLLFQSKQIINAYDRLTKNLKQKSKKKINYLKASILEQKSQLKDNKLQVEKLYDKQLQCDFNRQIQAIYEALEQIEKYLKVWKEKIENSLPLSSYKTLVMYKNDFLFSITQHHGTIITLSGDISKISQKIMIVIRKEKNVAAISEKSLNIFQEITIFIEQTDNILLQDQRVVEEIEKGKIELNNRLDELQNLTIEGNVDLKRFDQLEILNKYSLQGYETSFQDIHDQEKYRIKQIEDLITFCNDHLETQNSLKIQKNLNQSRVVLDKRHEELHQQFLLIEKQKEILEVDAFQQEVEGFCSRWKEIKEILTENYEDLLQQLRDSESTLIIFRYLIIIIKLHNLKRYKLKLITQGRRYPLNQSPQKKIFFHSEQILIERNPELKEIDSKIKYFEKIITEIQLTQIKDEQIQVDKENDELDLQIQQILQILKEQNERKLKNKFRSPDSIEILMQKVKSLEFNQGLIIQLIVDELENRGES